LASGGGSTGNYVRTAVERIGSLTFWGQAGRPVAMGVLKIRER
jgi:hypothetical protein